MYDVYGKILSSKYYVNITRLYKCGPFFSFCRKGLQMKISCKRFTILGQGGIVIFNPLTSKEDTIITGTGTELPHNGMLPVKHWNIDILISWPLCNTQRTLCDSVTNYNSLWLLFHFIRYFGQIQFLKKLL